jgi:hypothetical protein
MTTKTEALHPGEFILSEAEGSRSRDTVTILSGQNLKAGAVIGKVGVTLTVSAPAFSGTGNGAITMDASTPVLANAIVGAYTITCTSAVTNGGEFEVVNPNGLSLGSVKVGGTFADQIKFAIADGGTDFVVGDKFTATVTAGSAKYVAVPAVAALDGSDVAAGVLYEATDASSADKKAVAIVRDAEVDKNLLTFSTTSIVTA